MFLVKRDSTILCCGNNKYGQLGLNHCNPVTEFVENSLCPPFECFSQGGTFNAGICSDGHLWTCGKNDYGQLGLGHSNDVKVFTQVQSDQYFVSVPCAYNYMIALDDCGAIWICGHIGLESQQGQEFNLNFTTKNLKCVANLIKVKSDRFFTSISASNNNFCAIDDENTLWGCGENDYGQLGPKFKTLKVKTLTKLSNEKFQSVSCGINHVGAIKMDGSLWIHGSNTVHSLALTSDKTNLVQIVCGSFSTVALDNNGTLWSCGDGYGALGVGDYKYYHSWTKVGSGFVSAYLVNKRNVAALDDKGTLWFAGNMEWMFEFGAYSSGSYPQPKVPSHMRPFIEDVTLINSKIPQKHRIKASI